MTIARQRINPSIADLERARSLWLPSLFLGPTYSRADGQVQTVTGQVVNAKEKNWEKNWRKIGVSSIFL